MLQSNVNYVRDAVMMVHATTMNVAYKVAAYQYVDLVCVVLMLLARQEIIVRAASVSHH